MSGAKPRLRTRVREALVCPYCRDAVARKGTVVCGRRGCGALYHRECWEECAAQYGGCAVYGCESRKCREVSVAGYLLRLVRLALAALLFPPRLARAIQAEEPRSIFRQSIDFTRQLLPRNRGNADLPLWLDMTFLFIQLGTFVSLFVGIFKASIPWIDGADAFDGLARVVIVFAVATAVAFFGLVFAAVPTGFALALSVNTYHLIARALRAEVASLGRADQGDATVLGRLRDGPDKAKAATQ